MDDFLKPIIDFFTENIWNPGNGDFLGAVMFACLTALLVFFWNRLKNGFSLFLRFREQKVIIPQALRQHN